MKKWQKVAFGSPCFEAEECINQKFRRLFVEGGCHVSVILTLNVGLE